MPTYRVLSEEGPPHAKVFTVGVSVSVESEGEDCITAQGSARSKKHAERAAALGALEMLTSHSATVGGGS